MIHLKRFLLGLCCLCLIGIVASCTSPDEAPIPATRTAPPTPSIEALHVNGTSGLGARLRVTLRSVKLLKRDPDDRTQLFLVMADPEGSITYLLYPANRAGDSNDQFDLTSFPLELTLDDDTNTVQLWILAVHNAHYEAAERLGLDTLIAGLSAGFRNWLRAGDPDDDPLAAVVSASKGTLYEWFATIDVLGQGITTFTRDVGWSTGLQTLRSSDEGLSAVYSVQYISAEDAARLPAPPTATPIPSPTARPGYTLRVDETFENGISAYTWYEGQDNTYTNQLIDGAYEIKLTDIKQRDHGVSWGSLEGQTFTNYSVEAQVRLVESGVQDGRYGIWFHYQDDYNFVYFGLSNRGEYRVAIIKENKNRIEVKDWTPHAAIRPGAATNSLTIETGTDGTVILGINGEQVMTFTDQNLTEGSVAFFCYAESVPTTCRLERLRIWEPAR